MVPPWIGYSIWKFWVIRVLVSLVFHVFSTTELILHCKNSEFCRLSFSIIFLHDFILFGIDMHQNRSISLFKTLFDHFHFYPLVALKCYPHLIMCPNQTKNNDTPTIASLGYTGPSYISDWGRIYNSRRFCQRKCNSHDIKIYWILYKCEKSISRSKENRSQRELLSFFPDKDREKYAILDCDGEK